AIGFRKFFKKIISPFGNSNAHIGKKFANQVDMARLERKGICAVMKMDEEVFNYHGCTRKYLFMFISRPTACALDPTGASLSPGRCLRACWIFKNLLFSETSRGRSLCIDMSVESHKYYLFGPPDLTPPLAHFRGHHTASLLF